MKNLGLVILEHELQLLPAGVAGHVHVRHAVVDHVGPLLEEAVDDLGDALFVARDGGGGDDDRVPEADVDLVGGVGHAVEAAHGLALAAGGDDADLLVPELVQVVHLHDPLLGDIQIPQVAGIGDDLLHALARKADDPIVLDGHVRHLLDAVYVAGEGGHDDAALGHVEAVLEGLADLPLRLGVPRPLHVGGVGEKAQDALAAVVGQAVDVDGLAIEGRQVDLEVAGVQYHTERRGDGQGHRPGDGVAGLDELHLEAAQLHHVSGLHHVQGAGDVHLLELVFYEGHGQVRAVHGGVELLQGIGHGADMVLVAMGDDEASELLPVLLQIGHIRDYHVDARHVVVRERQTAVDDDDVLPVFEEGHILSDLAHAPQGDELQFGFFLSHMSFLCSIGPSPTKGAAIFLFYDSMAGDRSAFFSRTVARARSDRNRFFCCLPRKRCPAGAMMPKVTFMGWKSWPTYSDT